jgi:hypothetical protein
MKHDKLRSIAHNIADSFASGIGLLVGVYEMDAFEEARNSEEGFITVDFLNGRIQGGCPSASLAKAVALYRDALPDLCERQGASISNFRALTARFSVSAYGKRVQVIVEDENGRSSTDEYVGIPLKRVRILDSLGRVRPKRN